MEGNRALSNEQSPRRTVGRPTRTLLSGRHSRIGDAVLAAQAAYAKTGVFPELLRIYHLLGDPALKLQQLRSSTLPR